MLQKAAGLLASTCGVAAAFAAAVSCYAGGGGLTPPGDTFYFPVGLAVSRGGNVLYAANSDFDLQYNGGTLQSYDLHRLRTDAAFAILDPYENTRPPGENLRSNLVFGGPDRELDEASRYCREGTGAPPVRRPGSAERQPLGETCAPPMESRRYLRDSAIIGAFATDLQLSLSKDRLYAPVRGDTSLTWTDVALDGPTEVPTGGPEAYAPFRIACRDRDPRTNRCGQGSRAGENPGRERANTRGLRMPGEPFGMAQSQDGSAIVVTHQTVAQTSLFASGVFSDGTRDTPSLQFVLGEVPIGGNAIASVPHLCVPRGANAPCAQPRPAFLQTSRAANELALLRYYDDDGSTERRPFLVREAVFRITANASGIDSRGIAIDDTPRRRCLAETGGDAAACVRVPSRLFIANRSPASLLVGEVGQSAASDDGAFNQDQVSLFASIPLSAGPSRVYLAPIVDGAGNYALRVFVVCFDAATVYVFDPDANAVEAIVRVGPGPFAMAFDPFDLDDVALRRPVPFDERQPGGAGRVPLRRYSFAYLASFTRSYVQVLDLDNSRRIDVGEGRTRATFADVVFTLGRPTIPKGGT